jgi:hypothetical protein
MAAISYLIFDGEITFLYLKLRKIVNRTLEDGETKTNGQLL